MGKKNNNMLIYGAIALIAIVYILYKLLYVKEGFATTETCDSFCPAGKCEDISSGAGILRCLDIYYAGKDSSGKFTCNVNGFQGVIYNHKLVPPGLMNAINLVTPQKDSPICLGNKYYYPPGVSKRDDSIVINIPEDYKSNCDPKQGEISIVSLDNSGQRSYYLDSSGKKVAIAKPFCVKIRATPKPKSGESYCKKQPNVKYSDAALIPRASVKDKKIGSQYCLSTRVDTGEPENYVLK